MHILYIFSNDGEVYHVPFGNYSEKNSGFFFVNLYCLQFWTSAIIMLAILFFFSILEMQNLNLYYFSYN